MFNSMAPASTSPHVIWVAFAVTAKFDAGVTTASCVWMLQPNPFKGITCTLYVPAATALNKWCGHVQGRSLGLPMSFNLMFQTAVSLLESMSMRMSVLPSHKPVVEAT